MSTYKNDPPLKKEKRWRLDTNKVNAICPELFDRTKLTRGRAKDLKGKFLRDAKNSKTGFWILSIAFVIIYLLCFAYLLNVTSVDVLGNVGAFGIVIFGLLSSLGLHQSYKSQVSAGWEMEALVTKMDNEILQICIDLADQSALTTEQTETVKLLVKSWNEDISNIISNYGERISSSIKPLSPSK